VRDAEDTLGGYLVTVVVAVFALSVASGSSGASASTLAMALSVPAVVGWTVTVSARWAPLARSPMAHVRLDSVQKDEPPEHVMVQSVSGFTP
jgi:hypothetical protein